MVICHCAAVNDAAIAAAIDAAHGTVDALTVDEVVARCGAGGQCGACHDSIRAILERSTCPEPETALAGIGSRRLLARP